MGPEQVLLGRTAEEKHPEDYPHPKHREHRGDRHNY